MPDLVTRDRILQAARQELARHGFAGLSLRRVARHAGVDQRLVRYYYTGKEELCAEATRVAIPDWARAARLRGRSPTATGRNVGRMLLAAWAAHQPAGRALVGAVVHDERSAARLCGALVCWLGEVAGPAGAGGRDQEAAMATTLLLGAALLSCAGAAPPDVPEPGAEAALGDCLGLLLHGPRT
ncbi:TetR/AcrR family transcriptional regulator [Streptomyces poriticola]|uniref:TetR/AcrR family transcriptional regulator n=1 Tax=Streptomyces poriticola TaxID=3120506 RepID=UPI002FCE214E